jgi:hypothetical protein
MVQLAAMVWAVRDAVGVQRERRFLDTATAAELPANVVEHLVRFDIAVGEGHLHRIRMVIQEPRGERADDEATVALEGLVDGRRLVDGAGDRLEIVRVERERVDATVPADDVERVVHQCVSREPGAVLDDDGVIAFFIAGEQLTRAMDVAFAERGTESELAVVVQIAIRKSEIGPRFDDEQIGLALELQFIGRASRNDDVVERLELQPAEVREQFAPPAVDEHDLVGRGVAEQLPLRFRRAAAPERDVRVREHRHATGDRIARRGNGPRLQMDVSQYRQFRRLRRHRAGRFHGLHPRRRPQVVHDAVGPVETLRADHFLVVDAFALVPRLRAVRGVPFGWNRTELEVSRHVGSGGTMSLRFHWRSITVLVNTPKRSISSSTTSPGFSQPPTASGVSSRMQPVPTVPLPSTSPG